MARSTRAEWHDRATPLPWCIAPAEWHGLTVLSGTTVPPPLPWHFAFFCFVILGFGLDIKIPPWFEAIEVHQFGIRALITLLG